MVISKASPADAIVSRPDVILPKGMIPGLGIVSPSLA
jgi:hypothetical protein